MFRGFLMFLLILVFALTVSGMLTVIPLISTETNHFCGIELIIHDGDAWAIAATASSHSSALAVFGKTLMRWSKAEGFVFDQIELIPGAEG